MYFHQRIKPAALAALAALIWPLSALAGDWTTFGLTAVRNVYNPTETTLSPQTAPTLVQSWKATLPGPILTQPLFLNGVSLASGTADLVYVADLLGNIAALDAKSGGTVWLRQLSPLATTCSDFPGQVGVVGTPTIDRANNRMWVVNADGLLWAFTLDSGTTLSGYPLQILDSVNQGGQTINYGSPTYADGALYVTTASQCDVTPYNGQVIKVLVGTNQAVAPSVAQRWYPTGAPGVGPDGGGIWGAGGVSIDPNGSYIYAATGNAIATPENTAYADKVVKLNTDLVPTASNGPEPQVGDSDFGATPLLYQAPNCPPQAAAMNKSGILLVYDRSGSDLVLLQTIQVAAPSEHGNFIGLPVYDPNSNQIFLGNPTDYGSYSHGLLAFAVQGDCTLALVWQQQVGFSSSDENPMVPPTTANGVVYYATGNASSVYAFDTKGGLLWKAQLGAPVYASPTIVSGRVIVADYSGSVTMFAPSAGSTTSIVAATAPLGRTTTPGKTVTAFATIVNATATPAASCVLALPANVSATFGYQTTDPTTNALVGTANAPADIPGNGQQSYYFSLTPTATFAAEIRLTYKCSNSDAAMPVAGLNTFFVTSSASQLMDMVSIAVTPTGDGIVTLRDSAGGLSFFAGASINIGESGTVTLTPSTTPIGQPTRSIPVALSICQTDATGKCLTPLGSSVSVNVASGQTIVYAVFVRAMGLAIPFDPAMLRLFLIASQNGAPVGESSVAVRYSPGS